VEKISFKKIFKKSETDKKTGMGKMMLVLLIILLLAVGGYLGYPLLFPEKPVTSPVVQKTVSTSAAKEAVSEAENEPAEEEKTDFEIEVEQREQGYEEKIFTYEPYEPQSNRNPFEKVSNFYGPELITEIEPEKAGEQGIKQAITQLYRPQLPPGTVLTGIIDSPNKKIAIIEMNDEKYIANLYDILSDRYIVKEIKKNEVVIDIDGYLFSLKLGGEDLSDEL